MLRVLHGPLSQHLWDTRNELVDDLFEENLSDPHRESVDGLNLIGLCCTGECIVCLVLLWILEEPDVLDRHLFVNDLGQINPV